jgi:hypothetical protein
VVLEEMVGIQAFLELEDYLLIFAFQDVLLFPLVMEMVLVEMSL